MEGIRKVCINADDINTARNFNMQLIAEGNSYQRVPIPRPQYMGVRLSFPASLVLDYFIDPQSEDKDIIVFMSHRGEVRFEYNPILETQLETIMSVK